MGLALSVGGGEGAGCDSSWPLSKLPPTPGPYPIPTPMLASPGFPFILAQAFPLGKRVVLLSFLLGNSSLEF